MINGCLCLAYVPSVFYWRLITSFFRRAMATLWVVTWGTVLENGGSVVWTPVSVNQTNEQQPNGLQSQSQKTYFVNSRAQRLTIKAKVVKLFISSVRSQMIFICLFFGRSLSQLLPLPVLTVQEWKGTISKLECCFPEYMWLKWHNRKLQIVMDYCSWGREPDLLVTHLVPGWSWQDGSRINPNLVKKETFVPVLTGRQQPFSKHLNSLKV